MKNNRAATARYLFLSLFITLSGTVIAQQPKNTVKSDDYLFNDAHFHLTNYIQKGTDIHVYLNDIMGDKIGR